MSRFKYKNTGQIIETNVKEKIALYKNNPKYEELDETVEEIKEDLGVEIKALKKRVSKLEKLQKQEKQPSE